jgi:hypothetical protein
MTMTTTNKSPVLARMALALLLLAGARGASAGDDYLARSDSITPGVGDAVAHNTAVHTIDPWPPNVNNDHINIDGHRIQLGMRRYQANKSIQPRGISTSATYNGLVTPSQGDAGGGGDYGGNAGNAPDNK